VIPSLRALGRVLRRTPVRPTSVATLLGHQEAYLAFRRIVREIFPEAVEAILGASDPGGNRENARVWAFLHQIEDYFPIYEVDDYDGLAYGIPFARNAWGYDRFHELDLRTGELLLFALCAQPYDTGYDSRVALLDATEGRISKELLAEIPDGGISAGDLHRRLDGTPYAAAASYADWLWAETDSVFLDIDDEVSADIEWSRQTVDELAAHWKRAEQILDGIGALEDWLEEDPPAHFAELLDAALGRNPGLNYERTRRLYACEITEAGLVTVPRDETEPVAVLVEAAG